MEDHVRDFALDVGRGYKVSQETRLGVSLDDDDAAVALLGGGEQGGVGVEREVAGKAPARGDLLERGQGAGGRVDGEVDEGVGDDGLVAGGVEAGDLEEGLVAGRDDEELLVGLWHIIVVSPCVLFFLALNGNPQRKIIGEQQHKA